jgi:hypothetical protein
MDIVDEAMAYLPPVLQPPELLLHLRQRWQRMHKAREIHANGSGQGHGNGPGGCKYYPFGSSSPGPDPIQLSPPASTGYSGASQLQPKPQSPRAPSGRPAIRPSQSSLTPVGYGGAGRPATGEVLGPGSAAGAYAPYAVGSLSAAVFPSSPGVDYSPRALAAGAGVGSGSARPDGAEFGGGGVAAFMPSALGSSSSKPLSLAARVGSQVRQRFQVAAQL